ncbi:MAG: MFS transporter [Chlamydiae bacterium]|nr:MFS transporter [Chlamydiota bacterium]
MKFLPLLFTVFIDTLGFGLVMPMLGPLILEASAMMSSEISQEMRGWSYSLLIAFFCLGQFFGSPILGAISDRIGRKKIIVSTIILALFSYLIGIFSLLKANIFLFFLSRLLAGVAAGNYPIAQSYIADETKEEDKVKNFGLLGMSWGLGFILGPWIGGKCSVFFGSGNTSWTGPFILAGSLCVINLSMVVIFVRESVFAPNRKKISFFAGCQDLVKAFTHPNLKKIFLVMFLFCFGWGFFNEFTPIFLMDRLSFHVEDIGNFFACVGLWVAICQGYLIRPFAKRFSSQNLMMFSFLIFSILLAILCFIKNSFQLYFLLPFLAFFESAIYPSAASLISNISSKENQGEVLGVYNSVQWAAIGLSPFFSGSLIIKFPFLSPAIASFCMLLAFSVFLRYKHTIKKEILFERSS